ncbi:MAG: GNAT family protein [Candidatus Dormibacteria bacterium]|jgi:ribosomal-protein-alanine N-acetyltransferase
MATARINVPVEVGLRPWKLADAEELAAMYAESATELAVEEPWCGPEFLTAAGQRERVRRCLADEAAEGFVITVSGAIAGHLSLDRIRRDILQSADIGYWVAPRERHHGIATRAIGLAVAHAFDGLGLHRIHATVDLDNVHSWQALEDNGFQRMGVIHDFALVGDRWRDGHLYQLTAEEWMGSDATP